MEVDEGELDAPSKEEVEKIARLIDIICNHCSKHPVYGQLFHFFAPAIKAWVLNPSTDRELRNRLIRECMLQLKE